MKYKKDKPLSTRLLIIYLISALLFLLSNQLHIHTWKAAVSAEHGSAVAILRIRSF